MTHQTKRLFFALSICYSLMILFRKRYYGYWYYPKKPYLCDLSGKTVIITGATAGIGLAVAFQLALLNATIVIGCRNMKKTVGVIKLIQKKTSNSNISAVHLDLSDLASVKEFACNISKIDYLILNAGIGGNVDLKTNKITTNGLNSIFQVNYFAHWYLVELLLNKIKQQSRATQIRIISVSSKGYLFANWYSNKTEWNDIVTKHCTYQQSKLFQMMHMKQLQQKLIKEGYENIKCCSIHPGLVRTKIFAESIKNNWNFKTYLFLPIIFVSYPFYRFYAKTPMIGAWTVIHCVCVQEIENGGCYINCEIIETKGPNNCCNRETYWNDLWVKTKAVLKQKTKITSLL